MSGLGCVVVVGTSSSSSSSIEVLVDMVHNHVRCLLGPSVLLGSGSNTRPEDMQKCLGRVGLVLVITFSLCSGHLTSLGSRGGLCL